MPSPLVVSSTSGAASGAPTISAASGPSIAFSDAFCSSQLPTAAITSVFTGSASVVAIRPPQRKAAANSQGDSRSRRSRYQRMSTGSSASRLESASAETNTSAASGPEPLTTSRMITAASSSSTPRAMVVRRATSGRRSGETMARPAACCMRVPWFSARPAGRRRDR